MQYLSIVLVNHSTTNSYCAGLSGADLSIAYLSRAKLSDTDFSNAIIDNPDFLKHLHEKGSQNIPNEIKNKQELRRELLKKDLDPKFMSLSQLPEG